MKKTYILKTVFLITLLPLTTNSQFDRFGGWLSIKGNAGGYFHINKINNRHTLITPDGHAYYPLGINHMSVYSDDTYVHVEAFQNKRHALNKLKNDLSYFGMNCGGGGKCPDILEDQVPFFVSINLTNNSHYLPASRFGFQDVFEQDFISTMKAKIVDICRKYKNNRFLIGYYWTDTPRWDVEISRKRHLKDWVTSLRNQQGNTAGKQQYIAFLEKSINRSISFNKAYGLNFKSFDGMLSGRFDHIDFHQPMVVVDDTEFLGVIANHLYKIAAENYIGERSQSPYSRREIHRRRSSGTRIEGGRKICGCYFNPTRSGKRAWAWTG